MHPDVDTSEPHSNHPTACSTAAQTPEHLRAQLAAIVESSLDAIVGEDLNGIVTSWNRGAEQIFGHSADEMIGQPLRLLVPADRQAEEDHILAQVRRGEMQHLDTLRLTRDGRLIDVSVTVSPLRDSQGQLVGASNIARDLTTLRQHERELERMVRLYDALSQVSQAIVRNNDRGTLFHTICRVLVERGGLRMAWIGWNDTRSQNLVPVAVFGDDTGFLHESEIRVDECPEGLGPSGVSFRSGLPVVCHDLRADPNTALWHRAATVAGFHTSASVPLRQGGEICGVLSVYADRYQFFKDREVALLVEAATDVSFALDNLARKAVSRQVKQALRDESLFSQTMLDSMPGVVYCYDGSGRFMRWNRSFEVITGRSADEIALMHPLDFFTAAERPLLAQHIAEVFASGEASVEAQFVSSDGSTRPYFFTGRRVHFLGELCLVGVGIDISERKRIETALGESRAHLVEAQRIAGIGSWSLDLRTGMLTWSDQVYKIFGVDPMSFACSGEAFMQFVHTDDRAALRAAQQAALTGEAPLDIEHRIVLDNGSERVVHELALLMRDAEGQAIKLQGTVHDITVRVRLHAERERRHRAEAADRVKSAFLATMSHELRTPLNSIVGFTGILLRGLAGPLNPEQGKQLGMVQASARHLLALVNDVLDISKIEAGQMMVTRVPFDPRRSLEKVAGLVQAQAHAKGLALHLRLASLGPAVGDVRRFEQVVLNLLSNAIKFTDHGEIVLTADLKPDVGRFGVCVADTGIGLRLEDQELLFKPFRQVDSGLARNHEGTGLGLAICRRLVELMGGDIGVDSEFGRGSRFTVTLPLHPPGWP